jgi:hypothetical protein
MNTAKVNTDVIDTRLTDMIMQTFPKKVIAKSRDVTKYTSLLILGIELHTSMSSDRTKLKILNAIMLTKNKQKV